MTKNLNELANTFLLSDEKNLQFDFFRDNGQVLFQLYKQYDVNTWDLNFESNDLNSTVIELRFHEKSTNNKLNFERFQNCSHKNKFIQVSKDSYFMNVKSGIISTDLIQIIQELIREIFSYEGEFHFTLNAY